MAPQGRSLALTHPGGAGEHRVSADFTDVLGPETSQAHCFESSARSLVVRAVPAAPGARAESGVLLAYGVTGSGKTHSLLGGAQDPGIMPRALAVLFARVREVEAEMAAPARRSRESAGSRRGSRCGLQAAVGGVEGFPPPPSSVEGGGLRDGPSGEAPPPPGPLSRRAGLEVRVSLYEAYNERLRDLLGAAAGVPPARLRVGDATRGSSAAILGLREVPVSSEQEALEELVKGCAMRQSAGTGVHANSSRSHLVFGVALHWAGTEGGPASATPAATLSFVDLAGSERLARTRNEGNRLQESFKINTSLLTLGRCLETLHWNQTRPACQLPRRVPHRDSKITHIFNRVLTGQGSLTLLVTVAPDAQEYDETVHVLRYAALASGLRVEQANVPHPGGVDRARAPPAKRPRLLEGGAVGAGGPSAATDMGESRGAAGAWPCRACTRAEGEAAKWREEAAKWEGQAREWQSEAETVEAKVREEVAEEMAGLLREAEASYRARLETELASANRSSPPSSDRPRTRRQTKIAGSSPSPFHGRALAAEEEATALQAALDAARGSLEQQRLEAERAEAELRRRAEQAEEELSRARAELRAEERGYAERLDQAVEEARTQLLANNALEVETLEIQLERQQERNDRLRHHLSRANTTVAALMDRVEDNAREQEASKPPAAPIQAPALDPAAVSAFVEAPNPAPDVAPAPAPGGTGVDSGFQAESPAREEQEVASPLAESSPPAAAFSPVAVRTSLPGGGRFRGSHHEPVSSPATSMEDGATYGAANAPEPASPRHGVDKTVADDEPPASEVFDAPPPTTVRRRRRLGPTSQAALVTSPQAFMEGGGTALNKNLARVAGRSGTAAKGSPIARTPLARRTRAGRRALEAIENHLTLTLA